MKTQVLFPMAGAGSRFEHYHDLPKPLIPIAEKPMFFWNCAMMKKYLNHAQFFFVILKTHSDEFRLDQQIKNHFPDSKIIVLNEMTEGALETAFRANNSLDPDLPLLINDCDLCFDSPEFFNFLNDLNSAEIGGGLLSFSSNLPRYSYAREENGWVVETAEKMVISNNALIGSYYFSRARLFMSYAQKVLEQKEKQKNEYYIAPLYNHLIKEGHKIKLFKAKEFFSFGTPEELEKNLSKIEEVAQLLD